MLVIDFRAVVLRDAMKLIGGGEPAVFTKFGVVYERTEPFDGDFTHVPAKAPPTATGFACCVVRILTY